MFTALEKFWLVSFASVILSSMLMPFCFGQRAQISRYDLPLEKNEFYDVMPLKENGMFFYRRLSGASTDQVEIIKLDTAFQLSWKGYLPVDKQLQLIAQRAVGGLFYLLFRSDDVRQHNLQLYVVSQEDGKYLVYQVENFIPISLAEFHITGKAALMGGYYNEAPVVLYFSFLTKRSKLIPGMPAERGEFLQVNTFSDDAFDVLVKARNSKRQLTVWSKSYDAHGDLQSNFALVPEDKKHLMSARAMKTQGDIQLIAGVYGGRHAQFSRGLFLASVGPAGVQLLQHYRYGELENFFPYREERNKGGKEKGKQTNFDCRFLVREIVPYKNQYILLGEAFSRYKTYQNPRVTFAYLLTHAVVMGFDKNGKMMWDKSFEINEPRNFIREQFATLDVNEDRIALLYIFENELYSKIIRNGEVTESKTPLLAGGIEALNKAKTELSNLDHWYGDYFYAYGVQQISDPDSGTQRAFFINKIRQRDEEE